MICLGLKIDKIYDDAQIVKFTPDVGQLILYLGEKKVHMRGKTQILIRSNYHAIKQSMLSGKSSVKMNNLGIVPDRAQAYKNMKKRKRDEMETDRAEDVKEGSFRYKYQIGQTKNIRRPIPFDFFM